MSDPTRKGIVESEPGIFPPPVASLLRAFGRLFTRRRPPAQPAPEPGPPPPPDDDAAS